MSHYDALCHDYHMIDMFAHWARAVMSTDDTLRTYVLYTYGVAVATQPTHPIITIVHTPPLTSPKMAHIWPVCAADG